MSAKVQVPQMEAPASQSSSPYVAARREWDERYGDLITRAQNWRLAAMLALFAMVVAVFGLVALSMRSKVVPYVVAVDSVGKVVSSGPASEATIADDRMKRAAVYAWIQNLRMVSSDAVVQRAAIDKVYAMIASSSPAQQQVSEFYRNNSPLERGAKELVTVDVHAVYATSAQTFEVEWTEKTMDATGNVQGSQNYKGAFTIAVNPPTDEALARVNPLGIYVTNVSWSKVL